MKRISAFFLALALCLGLAVPAFAADENTSPEITLQGPENSGILMESKTETYSVAGFARGTNKNDGTSVVAYLDKGTIEGTPTLLVPTGVDIVISGMAAEDEAVFTAWSDSANNGTFYQRLFMVEPEQKAYIAPFTENGMFYTLPTDGKTDGKGNLTAAQLGFNAAQDGTITCNSDRLYELFETNMLLRITVGESFWLFQLSGEPKLISSVFTDVPVGKWVTDPVAWAVQNDITNGTEKDKFSPGKDCTQAQILTFLYRAARGEGEATAEDMEKAINWAREKGMIDDTFDSNKPCTRATAVNYIWQAFDKPSAQASSFTDVPTDAPYSYAVDWAVEKGVTNGTSDTAFSPDKVCNRGEIATFLYRAYN